MQCYYVNISFNANRFIAHLIELFNLKIPSSVETTRFKRHNNFAYQQLIMTSRYKNTKFKKEKSNFS